MSTPATPSLSIVVFAFNEHDNIRPMLSELMDYLAVHEPGTEIVFVDDGSSDGSDRVARETLGSWPSKVVRHEKNLGIGASLKTGVSLASAPFVTFLPSDGQVAPEAITTLREARENVQADVVFSIYKNRDDGRWRKLLSLSVRTLIFGVHQVKLQSDGPYLFRRDLFHPDALLSNTFFLNFEFPIRMLRAGTQTAIVHIDCRKRISGHSKSTQLKRIAGVAFELVKLRVAG